MRKLKLLQKIFLTLVCSMLVLVIATSSAAAQAKKKKKRHVRRAVASKTTTPPTRDATVVSLADQYQDSSNQIISPTNTSTTKSEPVQSDDTNKKLRDMQSRIKKLETAPQQNDSDDKQKRLLMNLDILTKAEQRAESLRKQRFDLIEKENAIRSRIDQIDADSRPEVIEKTIAVAGSLRPEELRESRRRSLDAEKRNLQSLLTEVTATRMGLDQTVLRADALVEKLRIKLEKDIDDALESKEPE